jgi:hypothetical protein
MECESGFELDIHFCRLSYLPSPPPLTLLVHVSPPPHTLFCMSHVFVHVVISCYCNFLFPYDHLKCIPCLTYVPSVDGKCHSTRKYSSSFWLLFFFHFIAWFFISEGFNFFNIPVIWNCFFSSLRGISTISKIIWDSMCKEKKISQYLWAYLVGSDNSY